MILKSKQKKSHSEQNHIFRKCTEKKVPKIKQEKRKRRSNLKAKKTAPFDFGLVKIISFFLLRY